jgi:chromosome segregation ATPase
MSTMSTTRALAKEAAFKLLQDGKRPTADRVRAAIGQGAQQTILGALDEVWQEIGARLSEPRLPEPLVEPVMALWSQAVSAAALQWQTERADREERIGVLERREQALTQDLREVTDAKARAETAAASADAVTAELQQQLVEHIAARQSLRTEVERLNSDAIQTRELLNTERAARDRDQAAWMRQIDAARQATKAALAERDALAKQLDKVRETAVRQRLLLSQAEDRVKTLAATLEMRTRAYTAAQIRVSTAEQQVESLNRQLQRTDTILEEHKAQLQSTENTLKAMTERLDALQLERERLLAEHRAMRDELTLMRARREKFEISVQRALGQLEKRDRQQDE